MEWPNVTEILDEIPEPTAAMVGRQFMHRDAAGNITTYNVITSPEGTPVIDWVNEPPGQRGLDVFWSSLITGINGPTGVAFDPAGNLYITWISAATNLRKYNTLLVQQWQTATPTSAPAHLATDGTTLFQSVPTDDRVYKRLASTGAAGSPTFVGTTGSADGQMDRPVGLAFDGTNLWEVDANNNRVQKLDASGGFVAKITGLTAPTGIALTATHIYVFNAGAGEIRKYLKLDLSLVATLDLGIGNGDGQVGATAEGIAIDPAGRIWIADTPNHRVQVLAADGTFLGKFGEFGSGDGQFKSPKQCAFNAAGDTLYVADYDNDRVVTLQEDTGQLTITERAGSSTNVAATSTASATATCNAGEVSIGGGIEPVGGQVYVRLSRRSGTTGWTIGVRNDAGVQNSFTRYVVCLKNPP